MYCTKCGKELEPTTAVCPACNAKTGLAPLPEQEKAEQETKNRFAVLWEILGFFFPLVGLFCFLGWRKSRPLRGASCGVGAVFGGLLFLSMAYFFAIFYFFLLMIGAGVTIGMV